MVIDKILVKTVTINALTSKVWDALTNPDIIKQWLFGTNVISDWKVGSPIFFTGTWQGTAYKDKGTILQFEKEKVFQYNYWSGFSGLADSIENYSIINFSILPLSNGTQLSLTQTNFPTETGYEHSDKNWDTVLGLMKNTIEK
ncbi:MAG: SRPBCC domain-containing protein [Sphingobacteriales bacterium]|nr:SRPBCC domain-containing protein [Sphingobacteriales bacterium]